MICNKCGAEVPDGTKYCMNCGAELEAQPQPEQTYTNTSDSGAVSPQQNTNQVPPQTNGGAIPPQQSGSYRMPYGAPYAPAPQPPKEEKANVWLVILSVLFPIAGLIIFFVDKDAKPKNAKACGLGALISFIIRIIMCIAGFAIFSTYMVKHADDFPNYEDFSEDFDFDEDFDLEDDYDGDIYGAFDTELGYYYNLYFAVDYNLPENFTFLSYGEIAQDGDYQFEEGTGVPYAQEGSGKLYYDSVAMADDNTAMIKTAVVSREAGYTDENDVLKKLTDESLYANYEDVNISAFYDKDIAGREFKLCQISYKTNDISYTECIAVTEEDGAYMLAQTVASAQSEEDASQLLTYYFY